MTVAAVTEAARRFPARIYLVGGAVRDRLRGVEPVDLDVVVEGDGVSFARTLAAEHGWRVVAHEPFGTAVIDTPAGRIDVATARTETYPEPGALPVVRPASLHEDLARRDFTINAIASPLAGEAAGELVDPFGGAADLAGGRIRVLHDGSFRDDPTRIIRAARYAARLGLTLDDHTAGLARAAAGGLSSLSPDRLHDALVLALSEERAADVVDVLADLGALAALGLRPARAAFTVADAIAAAVAPDAVTWRYRLALLGGDAPTGATDPTALVVRAATIRRERASIERYLGTDRHVRTELDGADVMRELAIGPSSRVGEVLADLLRRKVAGELPDRAAEVAAVRAWLPPA